MRGVILLVRKVSKTKYTNLRKPDEADPIVTFSQCGSSEQLIME